jgi:hypothetical protein
MHIWCGGPDDPPNGRLSSATQLACTTWRCEDGTTYVRTHRIEDAEVVFDGPSGQYVGLICMQCCGHTELEDFCKRDVL